MTQKVLKVGTSAAVTIPKDALKEMGVKIGDNVTAEFDAVTRAWSVRPAKDKPSRRGRIAKLTLDFIERYRSDLEALARR